MQTTKEKDLRDSLAVENLAKCAKYIYHIFRGDETDTCSFSQEEQKECIYTLSLYLDVDTARVLEMEQKLSTEINDSSYNKTDMQNNIIHIDSVVRYGLELIEQNKPKKLLNLLEEERFTFYAHPCNVIDNEIEFHNVLILLYKKYYTEKEYYQKVVKLAKISDTHIAALEGFNGKPHPYRFDALIALIELYEEANDIDNLIRTGLKLCQYTEACIGKSNKTYAMTVNMLSSFYKKAGMTEQADSCLRSICTNEFYDSLIQEANNQIKRI